jgi:hypothetical protein
MRTVVFRVKDRMSAAPGGVVAWMVRCTLLGLLIIVAVAGLIVAVPLAVLALAVGVIVWVVGNVRRAVLRAQAPNGPLDGRRNVRVIQQRDTIDSGQ